MKAVLTAVLGGAMMLSAVAPLGAAPSPSAPFLVKLLEQNKSGESGTAELSDTAEGLVVVLHVSGGNSEGPQPVHIHIGTCEKLDKVAHPLSNVVKGESRTTVKDVTIAELQKTPFAINVHHSTTDLATYVACGNIPK